MLKISLDVWTAAQPLVSDKISHIPSSRALGIPTGAQWNNYFGLSSFSINRLKAVLISFGTHWLRHKRSFYMSGRVHSLRHTEYPFYHPPNINSKEHKIVSLHVF